MNITLINAAAKNDPLRGSHPFMPLALPLLAATAPLHDYCLVDMLANDEIDFGRKTDIAGISMRFSSQAAAFEIADEYRRRGVTVVLGGPQASAMPMEAKKHADAVAVGEAERLWPRIISDKKSGRLRDFYVCSTNPFTPDGFSVYREDVPASIDDIPCAARSLFRRKYVFDTVMASRGCPIDCDFCAVTGLFGSRVRLRPVERVLAEIDTLGRYFYLLDDTVFGRKNTYEYYLKLYCGILAQRKKRFWTGQANLDAASDPRGREVIQMAAGSGMIYAAAGIESVNPQTLEKSGALKKTGARSGNEALDTIRKNIAFIQNCGIVISGWFVLGYPGDTIETYRETFEFCRETNVIPLVFPVQALPGTRLYEEASAKGWIDSSSTFNYRNPDLDETTVVPLLKSLSRQSFSPVRILARSAFYAIRFKSDRIHKTIFTMILQHKLRTGLDDRDGKISR